MCSNSILLLIPFDRNCRKAVTKKHSGSLLALAAISLGAGFSAPLLAEETATLEHSLTGNLGLFSSYRFRGIDQTFGKPALQGGVDDAHASGIYVGNWNSNVNSGAGFPDGNLEMDFYGGYKMAFGDFGIDVGGSYYYPGTDLNGSKVKNGEIYIGGRWKTLSLKYYYALTDYFSAKGSNGKSTDGTGYIDLTGSCDLGDGWGLVGHVGHLDFKNVSGGSYTDWKLGVTKDISGWVIGAAYVDTNAKGDSSTGEFYFFSNSLSNQNVQNGSKTEDAGRAIAVLSLSKSF